MEALLFSIIILSGVRLNSLGTAPTIGLFVPAPDGRWWRLWSNWWNEDWQGKPKYSEIICPSDTLSTTNSTWLNTGSNPGRRGGKPATNRLSYGADERNPSMHTVHTVYISTEGIITVTTPIIVCLYLCWFYLVLQIHMHTQCIQNFCENFRCLQH
jgi:hypothetical protein